MAQKKKAKTPKASPQAFGKSSPETLTTIQLRRGNEAELPGSAAQGEPLLCLDSKKLFTGMGTGQPIAQVVANATLAGVPVSPTPPTRDGELLIYNLSSNEYIPGDPIVSGPDAPGVTPTKPPVQIGLVDGSGNVQRVTGTTGGAVSVAGTVAVSNFPATQPVSAAALPLPAGAATDASLTNGNQRIGGTVAVSAAALPLPAGAATDASLTNGNQRVGGTVTAAASAETGTVFSGTTALTPLFALVAVSASGTVIPLVAAKKIRVLAMQLVAAAAVNVKWQSHVLPTDLTGLAYFAANGGYVLPFNPVGWFQTIAGEALDINLSASVAVGGSITYVTV
jgi:hypothetical protein